MNTNFMQPTPQDLVGRIRQSLNQNGFLVVKRLDQTVVRTGGNTFTAMPAVAAGATTAEFDTPVTMICSTIKPKIEVITEGIPYAATLKLKMVRNVLEPSANFFFPTNSIVALSETVHGFVTQSNENTIKMLVPAQVLPSGGKTSPVTMEAAFANNEDVLIRTNSGMFGRPLGVFSASCLPVLRNPNGNKVGMLKIQHMDASGLLAKKHHYKVYNGKGKFLGRIKVVQAYNVNETFCAKVEFDPIIKHGGNIPTRSNAVGAHAYRSQPMRACKTLATASI